MLTSQAIKEFALEHVKVDKVGVANIERFKDAPPDMNPLNIMPNARSVIVFAKRIIRGSYRGIDEGTHWPSYSIFGYAELNRMLGQSGYKIARFIEQFGYEATGISSAATSLEIGVRGPAPAPGKPKREVTMQHRIAATLAGLGEIGWSKVFLTEEFGPRQRLGIVLTEAELEPDPIKTGHLCDGCKCCVRECPGGAISKDKEVRIEVEGHVIRWGDIDLGKCKLTHFGLNKKSSPFFVKRFPGVSLPVGDQEVTWREAWDLGYAIFPTVPTFKALCSHPVAMCGARGCIVGCMKHMEKVGRVENTFTTRPVFSEEKPWSLAEEPSHRNADHHGF
ncbi:MAG TPA: hypothetical protein VHV83_05610, partial [Armatimonadota bacterium]|nr:hypothetical protein [Armatimonadota bacterium]